MHSFVDFMSNNGVPIYAVSVQNEPDITVAYESCDWNAAEMVKFVKEQGQAVGTKLIAPESFQFIRTISDAILNDSAAAAHVSIIGGHIYGGGLASYPLAASKDKELWMTEHLELDTSWTAVFATGKEIHDCMNAGMNAYIWWYIVRFYGPIHEDGYVTKRGYVMSQFSRFIRPGFTRVQAYMPRGSVPVTAYRRNSEFVIVAVNAGTSMQQTFRLENVAIPEGARISVSVTPYVTSPTKDRVQGTTITGSPSGFSVSLDSSSVTTLVGTVVTGANDKESDLPRSIRLEQNYPNPFNPSTVIRFALPTTSRVSLVVFDVLGRQVATLTQGERDAGVHTAEWISSAAASGLYFYRLAAEPIGGGPGSVETRGMMLVR
jgi:glucuronoarabinoxylan endo-1,4-beta-xylanase